MALKRMRGTNKKRGLCKLAMEENMTIYVVDALKQEISQELENYDKFELDLNAVEEIDSAGIQLILALRAELMRKKKELILTAVSGPVARLMKIYGVSMDFNLGDAA